MLSRRTKDIIFDIAFIVFCMWAGGFATFWLCIALKMIICGH